MIRHPYTIALALPLIASTSWSQAATNLKDAAAAVGLNIGVATNSFNVSNAAYATQAKQHFNMAVCENEMKFESTERTIGQFSYSGGDQVASFAQTNSMKMRGHTFIWHSQSGSAQNTGNNRADKLTIMKRHIDSVGGHFKTKIHEWDVLNEITADGSGGLRSTFWRTAIGDDYADSALTFARRVIGTNGHLYYNDYGGDGVNTKSTSMFNLAKKWQAAKVPLDGIGLQCHLSSGVRKDDISANIKRFGDLGLRISLTEIDIKNGTAADWTNLMNACLENWNCVSFVTWGLSDQASWIGSNCGCLLFSGSTPTPKNDRIQALIDAMAKADPAIVAKRKEFTAKLPGNAVPIAMERRNILQSKVRGMTLSRGYPIFSTEKNLSVDPMGRRSLLPVGSR